LSATQPNHYSTLGLACDATAQEIRDAYRSFAKRHHPDINGNSERARVQTQAINAAYEVLRDPTRRRAYDRELNAASRAAGGARSARIERNIKQDVRVRLEDLLRGGSLDVNVRDAGNAGGAELYQLRIPAGTAPGTRFRLARTQSTTGGHVDLRVKLAPGFRFKARGSDLQCELRIDNRRAANGGSEPLERPGGGGILRVPIPAASSAAKSCASAAKACQSSAAAAETSRARHLPSRRSRDAVSLGKETLRRAELVEFHQRHACRAVDATHDRGVRSRRECLHRRSFAVVARLETSRADVLLVVTPPVVVRGETGPLAVHDLDRRILQSSRDTCFRQRRPDSTDQHPRRASAAEDEAADHHLITAANVPARRDVQELRLVVRFEIERSIKPTPVPP
jgi:curved DNA-binding protein